MTAQTARSPAEGRDTRRRIWRIGAVEFDEGRRELRVGGERRALEGKPARLLLELLVRAGEVTTKDELLTAAWGNPDNIGEGSLTTAMSKLRAALGPDGRDVIELVHGVGYRIAKTAEVQVVYQKTAFAFSLRAGEAVPGRPQWRLEEPLGAALANDVWLARHGKTREARVFKFADTASRLDSLKREVACSRVLLATLGERPDFARVVEWNFEERPYFIESAYGGPDLLRWVGARGGLAAVPLATRIGLVAQAARSVSAAHGAGVLHSDLKPSNILVDRPDDDPRVRLVDFGAGGLTEAARTEMLTVTLTGLSDPGLSGRTGTLRYLAPEVLAGAAPTTAADVYALGTLLYQMVVGDIERPLTAGWEADVDDPLLREDIAEAAAGDAARRLVSASLLADRLETLPTRRAELVRLRVQASAEAELARRLERARARRPWAAAAGMLLAAGVAVAAVLGVRVVEERDEARKQAALAGSISTFLTEDVLGQVGPGPGRAEETLTDAAERAEAQVRKRFEREPLTAARIYQTLARAFDRRSMFEPARVAYADAASAFEQAEGPNSSGLMIVRLQRAMMDVVASGPGAVDKARVTVANEALRLPALTTRELEAKVELVQAQGWLEMQGGNVKVARDKFEEALMLADDAKDTFSDTFMFRLHTLAAFADLRLGRWEDADATLRAWLPEMIERHGEQDPDVLWAQLRLGQLDAVRGRSVEAANLLDRIRPNVVSTFGPNHHIVSLLLATEAQAMGQSGRYDQAVQLDLQARDVAVAQAGERNIVAIGSLIDAAESMCRAEDPARGIATATKAAQDATNVFGVDSALAEAGKTTLAFCLIVGKRDDEAAPLLAGTDHTAMAELAADPDFAAKVDLMQAQIAADSGDQRKLALKLGDVGQAFAHADADPYMKAWKQRLAAAANLPPATR